MYWKRPQVLGVDLNRSESSRQPPFTPAANSWRTPPSQPRASLRSRASACGPRDSRNRASTSTAFPPVRRRLRKMPPTTTPSASTSKSSSFESPDGRLVDARFRMSGSWRGQVQSVTARRNSRPKGETIAFGGLVDTTSSSFCRLATDTSVSSREAPNSDAILIRASFVISPPTLALAHCRTNSGSTSDADPSRLRPHSAC